MTREEAIAAGMNVHEIQHSMKRRTSWHDYSRKNVHADPCGERTYGIVGHVEGKLLCTSVSLMPITEESVKAGGGETEKTGRGY